MFIAYIIIAAMLALVLLASAAAKLRRDPRVTRSIHNILIAMNRLGLLDHSALSAQASPSTSAHRVQEVDTYPTDPVMHAIVVGDERHLGERRALTVHRADEALGPTEGAS